MITEVPFSPELIVSVEENWEYLHLHGILVTASCLLFAVGTVLPSYKVYKGFTEIKSLPS